MAFVAFGRLSIGAQFSARGERWVKIEETITDGKLYNARPTERSRGREGKLGKMDEAMLVHIEDSVQQAVG